jgi:hypothetical protein
MVPSRAPHRFSSSGEILIALAGSSSVSPCLHMLLQVIIIGDISMIPFFLSMSFFLISDAIDKTRIDGLLTTFRLGVLLNKNRSNAHTMELFHASS